MKKSIFISLICILIFSGCSSKTVQEINKADINLPVNIQILIEDQVYYGLRNSFKLNYQEEKEGIGTWPPVLHGEPAIMSFGEEINILIDDFSLNPNNIRFNLYHGIINLEDKEQLNLVHSMEARDTEKKDKLYSYTPQFLEDNNLDNDYLLEIILYWDNGNSRDMATYFMKIEAVPKEIKDSLTRTILSFEKAFEEGNIEILRNLFTERALNGLENGYGKEISSFYNMGEYSGWDMFLWEDSKISLVEKLGSKIKVKSIGPGDTGPYAEATNNFKGTFWVNGIKQVFAISEELSLIYDNKNWKIDSFHRSAQRIDFKETFQTEKAGEGVYKVGPFSVFKNSEKGISKDKSYYSFIVDINQRRKLITLRSKDMSLREDYSLELSNQYTGRIDTSMEILKTDTNGNTIFAIYGLIKSGKYLGNQGLWIQKVGEEDLKSLAFVPLGDAYRRLNYYIHTAKVTKDNKYMVIRIEDKLLRINLLKGDYKIIREDMPNFYTPVKYNEDGSLMVWRVKDNNMIIFNPITQEEVLLNPGREEEYIVARGIYEDKVIFTAHDKEYLRDGENGFITIGSNRIILYDHENHIMKDILPPDNVFGMIELIDEDNIYFTTGKVSRVDDSSLDFEYIHSKELFLWDTRNKEVFKIMDIDGHVSYLHKDDKGNTILWYYNDVDSTLKGIQKGIIIEGEEKGTLLTRNISKDYNSERYFYIGGRAFRGYYNDDTYKTIIEEITSEEKKTIIKENHSITNALELKDYVIFIPQGDGIENQGLYIYIVENKN